MTWKVSFGLLIVCCLLVLIYIQVQTLREYSVRTETLASYLHSIVLQSIRLSKTDVDGGSLGDIVAIRSQLETMMVFASSDHLSRILRHDVHELSSLLLFQEKQIRKRLGVGTVSDGHPLQHLAQ